MKKEKQRGITLIALIITIIIILILVAITVRTALNSGLFRHAGDATQKWADEQKKETEIGNGPITINGKEYPSIDEYLKETNKNLIKEITLDKTEVTLRVGYPDWLRDAEVQLTATKKPSDASNQKLEWTSSNNEVATVDENGKVTGKMAGVAVIKAKSTDGTNKEATCKVKVETSYGYKVDYRVGNEELQTELANAGITWQIAYADSTYTYLMASKCIPKNLVCYKIDVSSLQQVSVWNTPYWNYCDGTVKERSVALGDLPTVFSLNISESALNRCTPLNWLLEPTMWEDYCSVEGAIAFGGPSVKLLEASSIDIVGARVPSNMRLADPLNYYGDGNRSEILCRFSICFC